MNLESIEPGRVEEILLRHGAQSVALTDAGNDPVLEPAPGTTPLWLDSIDIGGKTLLDFGCGSGILSIAALKLGARSVTAVDIDLQAGILAEQVPEVIAAYHHRIEFLPPDYRDNWARLSGTRT